jgi:hypothetical protein
MSRTVLILLLISSALGSVFSLCLCVSVVNPLV